MNRDWGKKKRTGVGIDRYKIRVRLKKTNKDEQRQQRNQHEIPHKERKHGALRPQKPFGLITGMLEWGGGGGRDCLYLTPTRYTVTTRMILH